MVGEIIIPFHVYQTKRQYQERERKIGGVEPSDKQSDTRASAVHNRTHEPQLRAEDEQAAQLPATSNPHASWSAAAYFLNLFSYVS